LRDRDGDTPLFELEWPNLLSAIECNSDSYVLNAG